MSILGGLMQAGGYALQAKPKMYEQFGLAAVKADADEKRRKGKEQQDLQKQLDKMVVDSGATILEHQKEDYRNELTSTLASVVEKKAAGDFTGAALDLANFYTNQKTYVQNFKTVFDAVNSDSPLYQGLKEVLVGEKDKRKVYEIVEKIGAYYNMGVTPETGVISGGKMKRANIESEVNKAASNMLNTIEEKVTSGETTWDKFVIGDGTATALAGNLMDNPSIKAHYANIALSQNPDLINMEKDDIESYITSIGKADLAKRFRQVRFQKEADGNQINIYNLPGGDKEFMFGQTNTQIKTPTGDIMLKGEILTPTNTIAATGDNVLGLDNIPKSNYRTENIELKSGNSSLTYVVKGMDMAGLEKEIQKIATAMGTPIGLLDIRSLPEEYSELVNLYNKLKENPNAKRLENVMLNESQAKALSKLGDYVDIKPVAMGKLKQGDYTEDVYVFGSIPLVQSALTRSKSKDPILLDQYNQFNDLYENMQKAIGKTGKKSASSTTPNTGGGQTPSKQPKTGGGQPKKDWSKNKRN